MGYDMIEWLMERLNIEDSVEAIHMANLLCQHGYFFPVGECNKSLSVKDDSSLYRFQTPYYWASQNHSPENSEYVIYLYKRSLRNKQKHGLEEYELEALSRLKRQMAHKWEFIVMQAEEQVRLAKDRKKGDKIVTDSQERAYWRAYRPPPSFLNCLEQPPFPTNSSWISLAPSSNQRDDSAGASCTTASSNFIRKWKNIEEIKTEVEFVRGQLVRARIKVSVAAETLQQHCATYSEYDPFLQTPQPSNPWLSDDPTYWILNAGAVEVPTEKRAKRWAISIEDLVTDQTGLQELTNYLRKEYSHENIRFWLATNQLRSGPASKILHRVQEIYQEFLAPGAPCEINIDGRTMDVVQHEMKRPSRFTFDKAAEHVYNLLLKKDCYPRFVRSDHYKQLLANALQPCQKKRFFSFGATGKKKSIVAATSGVSAIGLPLGNLQQLNLSCGSSAIRRRGSVGERSLSGSPPDHPHQQTGVGPSATNTSLLLASSSANTAAASAGINSSSAMSSTAGSCANISIAPGDECDTPYRGDMPCQRTTSTAQLVSPLALPPLSSPPPPLLQSSSTSESTSIIPPPEREDNVCPWETINPPPPLSAGSGRTKGVLLTPGPSVDQTDGHTPIVSSPSAKKSSFSCSVESHPSTDMDVCPWESASAAPPAATSSSSSSGGGGGSGGGTRVKTPVAQQKSTAEVLVSDDVVCPWESQDLETPKNPTVKSPSEVTVIVLNPSKQVSPVISLAGSSGGSGHRRKESASGVTAMPEPGSEQSSTSQQPDKSSSKISDICPWEDEESCKLDQPFVKTYATLGYL
ncbi:uncharacterized protein LOC124327032 isoform X1 [Daphnia pulicaria]|uniref:uncharacterized protein LOC124327032 isoform X1 n=1 Tax=Daphnia pulicaria TaxID=35523 RepID=UPI001EEB766F|nr:uncharacterized protein LOC124327032 isoform X1 [Daphnia pulicaria]XP_046641796.1 uncharacterized protein LOC124327032 isoform X1 [Daphnia pulicaria]